jgi:hypothetical protein
MSVIEPSLAAVTFTLRLNAPEMQFVAAVPAPEIVTGRPSCEQLPETMRAEAVEAFTQLAATGSVKLTVAGVGGRVDVVVVVVPLARSSSARRAAAMRASDPVESWSWHEVARILIPRRAKRVENHATPRTYHMLRVSQNSRST